MRRRVLQVRADDAGLGPQLLVAFVDLAELIGIWVTRLEEIGIEATAEWNIRSGEPDDTVIGLVDMAVPAHRECQDEIALMHVATSAIDDGSRTLGASGKANRRECVSMRPRPVARIQHRKGGDQV